MPSVVELVEKLTTWALPVLLALTGHAIAMALVAWRLCDLSDALRQRLSWNPLTHVDRVVSVLVLALLLLTGGFMFGWPKTVPVNPGAFREPRKDMAIVALAAVGANAVMAFAWTVLLKGALAQPGEAGLWLWLQLTAIAGVKINLIFMMFGLLPIPGFAGGHVVGALLPPAQAYKWYEAQQWSLIILFALLITGVLSVVIVPPVLVMQAALFSLVGIA